MIDPKYIIDIEGIKFYHDPLREPNDVTVCFQSSQILDPGFVFAPYIPLTRPEGSSNEDFVPLPELKPGRREFKDIKLIIVGSTDLTLCEKIFDSIKLRYD